MLQLASKPLPVAVQQILDSLQLQVDGELGFVNQAKKAQKLWGSKGNAAGKRAFQEIVSELKSICVYVEVCNYCEQNEANDIEHIYPKSFFPGHAFRWDNYILACKQCNTAYKLDKCFVLDQDGNVHEVERGTQPLFPSPAIINPRIENPTDFMWMNLETWEFEIFEELPPLVYNKADRTLFVLQLNNRDLLLADRKNTAIYYYQRMDLLRRILASRSVAKIKELLSPYEDRLDNAGSLKELKTSLKESFKAHISRYKHPSVWYSIKTIASKTDAKWQQIFKKIPDALSW